MSAEDRLWATLLHAPLRPSLPKFQGVVFASLQSVPHELEAGKSRQPGKELETIFASGVKTRGMGGRQTCIYNPTLPLPR